ncbi:fumarate reductase subunit D [Thermocatellispora tengchongensis]|uniref:Fumarate reductase subunit D n=1 Tax=Thermocatellispora tengchongensis TaxID=1073253 RepID=A0A840NVJ3_9ACTN|nr:fumarate reductase subunit FrdD [Thermocatellispora tengchongensis]MBB5131242.1 fumarate reductase subunit D [Thermocatellispora tengchongensis]
MRARRTPEPYLWLLFSGGGVVAALLLPVLVLIFGVLAPLGVIEPPPAARVRALLDPLLVRLALAAVVGLCLFHAAHRIRFTVEEMTRGGRLDVVLAPLCYGAALTGTVIAVLVLF